MPTKNAKQLIGFLEQNGYEYARMNTKGFLIYEHPQHPPVSLSQSPDENAVRHIMRSVQKTCGARPTEKVKRNAGATKERQAAERDRMRREEARKRERIAQLNAEIDSKLGEAAEQRRIRDAQLGGLGAVLTSREVRDVAGRVEQEAARTRALQRLMVEIPTPNAHAGRNRAEHRA